ncbi:nicotinate-nicotinamide nucleotide adenylyltransferase [Psychrobacter sp. M13]|uniref:nicotinate-nicotinamide nucleotide adenylyltransferase n=1 Tax=Psychrobacter sp. M13 TaxID=3067275 RepID=UPI00273C01B2|nr:nicotinate-nicotinamide nucleotide adenylyltransferase [Psychrobacter sp. M13]WLP94792.1 nicotinate-nicotinamide nucleotide adenylyltransferase [Psychrobacter sp. M13]
MNKQPAPFQAEKNIKPAIRAYLGGSFDPIHLGHMQMAMAVYNTLAPMATERKRELQVSLLPNARSPFKTQSTDPSDRLAMLNLAVQETPVNIDELELWQTPPVYTIDSVRTLRNQYPHDSLIFIMGMDSVRNLDKWKQGLQLTDYINLWVFNRDETLMLNAQSTAAFAKKIAVELQAQVTESYSELLFIPVTPDHQALAHGFLKNDLLKDRPLKDTHQGRIYIDTRAVMSVSSTEIRQQFREQNLTKNNALLPSARDTAVMSNQPSKSLNPKVYDYIIAHQLYSAD